MKECKTINYYNSNAKEFVSGTVSVDFESIQKKFTDRLPEKSVILDFGCGSGRDTKYFMSEGYQVDAVDGSIELCRLAREYTGMEVENIYFDELAQVEKYDGIRACSSMLHLPLDDLTDVMSKMIIALKVMDCQPTEKPLFHNEGRFFHGRRERGYPYYQGAVG